MLAGIASRASASAVGELTEIRSQLAPLVRSFGDAVPFHESERVATLYARAWRVIADDATAWLRAHPEASADRLAAAIERVSPPDAEKCRREAWSIDARREVEFGFTPEPFEASDPFYDDCWAIDARAVRFFDGGESTYAAYVTYGYQGRVMLLSGNGVLPQYATLPRSVGGIYTLPDDAGGRHRFYVDARPADANPLGATACRQLQIFSWNGRTLEALIDTNYSTIKGTSVAWDGHALGVRTKGSIRSFGTCGGCEDLAALWRIDVTPDAVHSRDLVYDQPLFPLVDEFIVRVRDGGDWHALGSPRAARHLAALLERDGCERPCTFGFVSTSVEARAGTTVVDLALELRPGGTVSFDIRERDGHPYVENVRFAPRPTRP